MPSVLPTGAARAECHPVGQIMPMAVRIICKLPEQIRFDIFFVSRLQRAFALFTSADTYGPLDRVDEYLAIANLASPRGFLNRG